MKRFFALLLTLCLLPAAAFAQGQTVSIATTFSGYDMAAQAYADALESWEAVSGNVADDYSGMPDDAWQQSVNDMLANGTLDIYYTTLDLPQETLAQLVRVDELLEADAALPVCHAQALSAADGNVYAIPVRFSFEALYVNTDLFLEHGVALPDSWESLLAAVDALKNAGVTPIANAVNDWPAALADCAILSAGTSEAYLETEAISESYALGFERIRTLYERGAFGDQALTWTDLDAEAAFLNHEAAMRVDGEWLCELIAQEQWSNTTVIPFPGTQEGALVAGANAGFYMTRAAFDDPARREAALSLLRTLVSEPTASTLFLSCGGALMESVNALFEKELTLCPPLMDVIGFEAFDQWMLEAGNMAAGSADIAQTVRKAFE